MKVLLSATLKNGDGTTSDCTAGAAWFSSDDKLLKVTGAKPPSAAEFWRARRARPWRAPR
jgi:hypothetical protein